ncbi:PaaI family thioesterase [Chelatococcus reniformis]|uniref:Phenylacetic acid degradation protein n=1 Tax=Chelatococcus reniformis TaxID=1494448 RepID=A0A916TWG5_9HYPH|nr:PaaI family thioesterase [Chelatococcus reniformis]GGC46837.1 phenylacetic acid degradation protein [Chelatococcus reniformis]
MNDATPALGADRSRVVTWVDPAAGRSATAGLSGLEIMQGIRDRRFPPPPMAALIGFDCTVAEEGRIAMELDSREDLENLAGMLHGGAAATVLDTAMGAAAHTLLPAGWISVTLDIKLTYMRPITLRSGRVRGTGRVLNRGRQTAYVEGELRDGRDALCVHAVGNFSLIAPERG